MDKPARGLTVGKFLIWPDSDSGSRSNDLRIECTQGEYKGKYLVLTSYTDRSGFYGTWNPNGWPMPPAVFSVLTSEEADMLREVGVNLPLGMSVFAGSAARLLTERVDKVGAKVLEATFEKVFKLCHVRVRRMERMERPRLLRWWPI